MAISRMSWEEMNLLNIYNLPSFSPHYWSQFILLAEQLLTDEEREELRQRIFDIEKMILETEVIPERDQEGKIIWVERIRGELSLYDIEMAFESNQDYYAYFEKDDGTRVTKFDIERRLDALRKWIFDKVREKAANRRFTRMR